MDISEWLRKLGLEQYEPAFRENKIDADLLPSLTAEDLKDLGITLVGDRRRLLGAIAALQPAPAAEPGGSRRRAGHGKDENRALWHGVSGGSCRSRHGRLLTLALGPSYPSAPAVRSPQPAFGAVEPTGWSA